jgi:uncharacterized protein (TIGR00251 family)
MSEGDTEMVRPAKDGCQIRVRVKPRASEDAVLGRHGSALKVAVRQPPEKGRANRALRELLGRVLRVPPSSVSLTSGEGSQDKLILIVGLSAEECKRRLEPLLER